MDILFRYIMLSAVGMVLPVIIIPPVDVSPAPRHTTPCALFPFGVFADRSVHLPSLFPFLGLPRLCLPPAPSQNDLALP